MAEPAPELEPHTASYPMTPGPIATTPERRSTLSSSSYEDGPRLARTRVSEGMPAQISHRKLIAKDPARKISGTFATSAAHRSVIESALFDETVMDATKILADTLIPASSVDQILKMESTASLVVTSSAVELGSAPKSELKENFNYLDNHRNHGQRP